MDVKGKNIWVGLSGGVDSAVSAALLLAAGARVTGVYIKGWYPRGMPCTWAEDRKDAMRVAARLHIPFFTLDASKEYKKGVIDYLLSEYRFGRTPNPDVMCNREVKFGAFYRYALAHGADAIATGHYRSGEKDQSYFLWAVPQDILAATVFPVGHMRKEYVRELASKYNLPVATKKDSQGVCFLGSISVEDFLKKEFGTSPGNAYDEEGRLVGKHNSVLLHTIGERIALTDALRGPWFVLAKHIEKNELVVGKERLFRSSQPKLIHFETPNWMREVSGLVTAQYRYRGPRVRGTIRDNMFTVNEPLPEIPASGQSIVFYRENELVGGGILT